MIQEQLMVDPLVYIVLGTYPSNLQISYIFLLVMVELHKSE